jgi:hypothetical protein
VEQLGRDAHGLLAVHAAPHVGQLHLAGRDRRLRQQRGEVEAGAAGALVAVVEHQQALLLRPARHAHGVVAQQGHQRVELVRAVVHRQEEGLHAHQPHQPLGQAVVAVGARADDTGRMSPKVSSRNCLLLQRRLAVHAERGA